MRCYGLLGFVCFAAAFGALPAAWAAPSWSPPQWGSDNVRAARPTRDEEALTFDVLRQMTRPDGSTQTTSTAVVLTASFDEATTGRDHLLNDYLLCRTFDWSDGEADMSSASCYAYPAFAAVELQNRQLLNGTLAKIKVSSDHPEQLGLDPYWSEAELGVQEVPSDRLVVTRVGDLAEYRLKGQVVVRLTGEAAVLSKDEAAWVSRYLARNGAVHPQVRRDLKMDSSLPARLEIQTQNPVRATEVLSISNIRRRTTSYPLPPGLQPQLRTRLSVGDGQVARGLHSALTAADGLSSAPSEQSLIAQMQGAAKDGRQTTVLLLFFNFTQQYAWTLNGPDREALMAELRPLVGPALNDPEAGKFWQASSLAGDAGAAGDRTAAATYLAGATVLDRLPFGTFRYVTFANLIRGSRDSSKWAAAELKRMPSPLVDNYWVHIAAYPWAGNAYKDAGDAYFEAYDMENAWLAYDLGRAIDPNWKSGVLANVSGTEQKLRLYQPDFF